MLTEIDALKARYSALVAAAAAAEGDGVMSDDDLMDQNWEKSLDMEVLASPIVVRPFCGPLPQQPQPEMLFGPKKRARTANDDLNQTLTAIKRQARMYLSQIVMDSQIVMRQREALTAVVDGKGDDLPIRFSKMSVEQLKKVTTVTSSKNNDHKYRTLRALVFPEAIDVAKEMEAISKHIESSVDEIVRILVSSAFASEEGVVNWEAVNEQAMQAIIDKERAAATEAARSKDVPM
jgi:hypothetical protein